MTHTGAVPTAEPAHAPRARDAAATRADLLRAAKRRFTMYGFGPTTSRQIASDAGANVSLINRYFGSKEGLYEAVVQETADTLDGIRAGSTAELLEVMVRGFDADAWPEFGNDHPLLLLLRANATDARSAELRRRSLAATVNFFAGVIAADAADRPGKQEAQLRAGMLLAEFVGVIMLRDALPEGPFRDARLNAVRTRFVQQANHIVCGAPD